MVQSGEKEKEYQKAIKGAEEKGGGSMRGLFHCLTCHLSINDSYDVVRHAGTYPDHIIVTGDQT